MKSHNKRLTVPKTWKIKRKSGKFLMKASPGGQKLNMGLPLVVILRDYLGYAKNAAEVKKILASKHVLIDNKRNNNLKHHSGLMDVITIKESKEFFRVMFDSTKHLNIIKIPEKESMLKPKKIINKTKISGGETQLNFYDGHNMLVKEDSYKVGDTVLIEFPGRIVKHIKFDKGSLAYMTGGKHIGQSGIIDTIDSKGVLIKTKAGKYMAKKDHIFIIGEKQPCISLGKEE